MSLPTRIETAVIKILDGATTISTHNIKVSDLSIPTTLNFWDEREGLSITGKRRKRNIIRGFDREVTFQFEDVRNQENAILDLIDDLKVATDNDYDIRFNASGDIDYIFLVPDEAIFNQDYINQIIRTPTTIGFKLAEIQNTTGYS